jgi:hypothetical protein
MNVNPWVIPDSLRNLPPVGGRIPGFHFIFRADLGVTHIYVAHRMTLTVDGTDVSANLWLKWKGQTAGAADLPETDWIWRAGEAVEVIAEKPGGLAPGQHILKLEALMGGTYGGRAASAEPRVLCEFEDDLAVPSNINLR